LLGYYVSVSHIPSLPYPPSLPSLTAHLRWGWADRGAGRWGPIAALPQYHQRPIREQQPMGQLRYGGEQGDTAGEMQGGCGRELGTRGRCRGDALLPPPPGLLLLPPLPPSSASPPPPPPGGAVRGLWGVQGDMQQNSAYTNLTLSTTTAVGGRELQLAAM
jgi:hypothetical protein